MKKAMTEAIEITKYIEKFLMFYVMEHQTVSEHTARSYNYTLKSYLEYLETLGVTIETISYEHFKKEYIENWLLYLSKEKHLEPQSINIRLAGIRVFLYFLKEQDIKFSDLYNHATLIKRRNAPKIKVKGVSKKGIKALFNAVDTSTSSGYRDLTLLLVLYNTAIRIDELLSLKIENIYLYYDKPFITITGKGNKVRSLYLLPQTVKCLKHYIKDYHGDSPKNHDYLFYSKIKGKDTKLTQPAVCKQIRKWAAIANQNCAEVPVDLHPHQIRHAAASHWLDDGMNIVQISYLLGHEQLQTTMIYLEITTAQEAEALNKMVSFEEKNKEKKWKKNIRKLSDLCK